MKRSKEGVLNGIHTNVCVCICSERQTLFSAFCFCVLFRFFFSVHFLFFNFRVCLAVTTINHVLSLKCMHERTHTLTCLHYICVERTHLSTHATSHCRTASDTRRDLKSKCRCCVLSNVCIVKMQFLIFFFKEVMNF